VGKEAATEKLRETFADPPCCGGRTTQKIKRFFKSAPDLLRHPRFASSARLVCRKLRLTNMWSERQLAQCKKDVLDTSCCAETASSKAFLGQALRLHMRSGKRDPRVNHRAWLLEDKVPIRAGRNKAGKQKGVIKSDGATKTASKPCGGFLLFKKEMEAARGGKYTRNRQAQWLRSLSLRWGALPGTKKCVYALQARVAHDRRLDEASDLQFGDVRHGENEPATFVSETSNDRTPFGTEFMDKQIRAVIGEPKGGRVPGFFSYGPTLRKSFTQGLIVHDSQAINDDKSFDYVALWHCASTIVCS
jgi:hypothetical protein